MRLQTICPRCGTWVETEMDKDGDAVCPKCENTFHSDYYDTRQKRISDLEAQLATTQARLAAFEEGYDPITTLARGCKQVLVKFKDGYAGEPSEFMIVMVNRKGEICDGVIRWFPLPGTKEDK